MQTRPSRQQASELLFHNKLNSMDFLFYACPSTIVLLLFILDCIGGKHGFGVVKNYSRSFVRNVVVVVVMAAVAAYVVQTSCQ